MTTKPVLVHGVNMGAVKIPLVDAALARRSLAIGGTDQQKVGRLAQWYGQHTPKGRIADCSTCGGESDVEEPACPFCGDGESDVPAVAPAARGTSGKSAAEAVAPPAGLVRYPGPRVPPPRPVEVLAPPASEAALDAAVAQIGELMHSAADRLWELGAAVKDVFDRTLWSMRKTDDGAARYKSWGQFCETELGISHGYSLKLMDVASVFSREQVRTIGASKLYITLQVPKAERDKLLGAAEAGASKRDLEKLAQEVGKEKRDTGRKGKGGAGTHKGGPKGGRKLEKITVAMLTTRVEMHPVTSKGAKVKLKVPHAPLVAEERMFNGVKQRIVVTTDEEGFLLVVVERVRE